MKNIYSNEVVKNELVRIVSLIGTDDGRNIVVDIELLKNAIDEIDKLVNGSEQNIAINGDMWFECQDSMFKILDEFELIIHDDLDDDDFEYDNQFHISKKPKRPVDFALTRAFYIYGVLEAQNLLDESINGLDTIEAICVKIADDWDNRVDIQSQEEEGYPTAYVERILIKQYGRKK